MSEVPIGRLFEFVRSSARRYEAHDTWRSLASDLLTSVAIPLPSRRCFAGLSVLLCPVGSAVQSTANVWKALRD
jgi:hypothetical protein